MTSAAHFVIVKSWHHITPPVQASLTHIREVLTSDNDLQTKSRTEGIPSPPHPHQTIQQSGFHVKSLEAESWKGSIASLLGGKIGITK
jgi:hypothetical protein